MKSEIYWVNSLKFLGILFVILGHIQSPFSHFIFSFHMPLFFMLSGFFVGSSKDLKLEIKNNFLRLMSPYFIFGTVALIAEYLKRLILHRGQISILEEVYGFLVKMDMQGLVSHYGFVLWFLPALFISKTILATLFTIMKKPLMASVVCSVALFIISLRIDLPFGLDNGFNSLIWVLIGYLFFNLIVSRLRLYHAFVSVLALALIYCFYGVPDLDIASKTYDSMILLNFIWGFCMLAVLTCVVKIPTFAIGESWGRQTMLIFILHTYTNNVSTLLVDKLVGEGQWILKFGGSVIILYFLLNCRRRLSYRGLMKYV